MKSSRLRKTLCALLLIPSLTVTVPLGIEQIQAAAPASDESDLTIYVASDLHYISPEINDNGPMFQDLMARADGKVTIYCEQLTEAFLEQVRAAKPDVLLLTGDLSFNGELPSHQALAEKFQKIEEDGITVLVTTGNHDVNYEQAAVFSGDSYTFLDPTTPEAFETVYRDYGYAEAISRDERTLSYVYQLDDRTRILVLDLNAEGLECKIGNTTFSWIEEQLKQAEEDGALMLSAGHQNLYQHSWYFDGYVISQWERLWNLFQKYHVPLYMSGHMHIQHCLEFEGVAEITSSALSVSPCQFGILSITENDTLTMHYETKKTDVSGWAEKTGSTDEKLLDFENFAADYMAKGTRGQQNRDLDGAENLTDEEKTAMIDYARKINAMYFAGDLTEMDKLDPTGVILEKWLSSGTMMGFYLKSLQAEAGNNYTVWDYDSTSESQE